MPKRQPVAPYQTNGTVGRVVEPLATTSMAHLLRLSLTIRIFCHIPGVNTT